MKQIYKHRISSSSSNVSIINVGKSKIEIWTHSGPAFKKRFLNIRIKGTAFDDITINQMKNRKRNLK